MREKATRMKTPPPPFRKSESSAALFRTPSNFPLATKRNLPGLSGDTEGGGWGQLLHFLAYILLAPTCVREREIRSSFHAPCWFVLDNDLLDVYCITQMP